MNETIALEKQYVLQTYVRPNFVIIGGDGVWLVADDGTRYLDGGSGIAVNALGHGHPVVQTALKAAAAAPIHLSNLYHNMPMAHLARDLCESCFADRVFFANSGSEANEGAFKFARKYARTVHGRDDKTGIVAFSGSFHGRSMGAVAATATEKYRAPFEPVMPGVTFADFNNIVSAENVITKNTCAVIVEPVQGEGGVTPADGDFLAALRRRCDEVGALLIFDEVQCGAGRTGALWAHQIFGVEPDIMTAAKPLAGGLPMGAILMTQAVADVMQPGDHGSTFAGGPFVSRVARAVFSTLSEPEFLADVRRRGDYLARKLRHLLKKSDIVVDYRGRGMMWGLLTTIPAAKIVAAAMEQELLILSAGAHVVRLLPPLVISETEIDVMIDRLAAALQTVR